MVHIQSIYACHIPSPSHTAQGRRVHRRLHRRSPTSREGNEAGLRHCPVAVPGKSSSNLGEWEASLEKWWKMADDWWWLLKFVPIIQYQSSLKNWKKCVPIMIGDVWFKELVKLVPSSWTGGTNHGMENWKRSTKPYGSLFLPLMKIAGNAQFGGEISIGQWAMYRWAAFWIALLKYRRVHYLKLQNWFLSPGTLFYSRGDLGKAIPCQFFQWLVFGAFQAILDIIHHICEILSRGKKEPETSGSQWQKRTEINDKNLWDSYGFMVATNTTRKQRKLSKSQQISSENVAP